MTGYSGMYLFVSDSVSQRRPSSGRDYGVIRFLFHT